MRPDQLHDRFSNIVPQRTRDFTVLIAGAGMVGSWTALALARMVKEVHIWDFDVVSAENIGVQAYHSMQIGRHKTEALEALAVGTPLTGHVGSFPEEIPSCDIVISCVDSIEGRRKIAEDCYDQDVSYFIDTRVLGEIACIFPVYLEDGMYQDYILSLPEGDELVSAPCGSKGTAFAGMWVASQVCAIVNSIGRGLPLCPPKMVWHVGMNQSVAPEEVKQPATIN